MQGDRSSYNFLRKKFNVYGALELCDEYARARQFGKSVSENQAVHTVLKKVI